jgi:carbon storage regulator
MLVLSRKTNESIVIDGNITVSVLRVDHDNVRLGIEAPLEIPVLRKEIYEAIKTNNEIAAGSAKRKVKQVKLLVKN